MKDYFSKRDSSNVVLAFCLVAFGVLANPWLLEYLSLGTISLRGKIFLGLCEFFLIISGLLVYFKGNTPEGRKRLFFGFIAAALVVLITEAGLHLINFVIKGRAPDEISLLFRGNEWGKILEKETFEIKKVFVPFVEWGIEEYHGKYVNINSEGIRKTWNPQFSHGEKFKTIYTFGPSTLWGVGARDEYTIPSHLSKMLDNNGYDFIVYNYGELAYVFTQQIVQLALLLKEGHRPDYVLCYEGAVDIYAAYQSGAPGIINPNVLKEAWGHNISSSSAASLVLRGIHKGVVTILSNSMIYKAIGNSAIPFSPQQKFPEVGSKYNDNQLRLLSQATVKDYLKSMDLLNHLADVYDFKYAIFWQPCIYTKEELTNEEKQSDRRVNDRNYIKFYQLTANSLVAASPPHFFDISGVFSNDTKKYYGDITHISEEGNEKVADIIFRKFEKEFLR